MHAGTPPLTTEELFATVSKLASTTAAATKLLSAYQGRRAPKISDKDFKNPEGVDLSSSDLPGIQALLDCGKFKAGAGLIELQRFRLKAELPGVPRLLR